MRYPTRTTGRRLPSKYTNTTLVDDDDEQQQVAEAHPEQESEVQVAEAQPEQQPEVKYDFEWRLHPEFIAWLYDENHELRPIEDSPVGGYRTGAKTAIRMAWKALKNQLSFKIPADMDITDGVIFDSHVQKLHGINAKDGTFAKYEVVELESCFFGRDLL